jgi:hypothetical protein
VIGMSWDDELQHYGDFVHEIRRFLITVRFHCVALFLLVNLFFINKLYQKRSFFSLRL